MPSSASRAPSINSQTPQSSRSLLSRMKSPFTSKARNFAEFDIQPDDPHRQYSPGDVVSGSVILTVVRPVRITHLVIALHGYAQVYKNPNSPGDGFREHNATVATGRGSSAGGYFGNGFASLFEDEVPLCGEGRLGEGVYHFRFDLVFPSKDLPSSIDFERGTISYMLTATLTRPTTMSPTTSCDQKVYLIEDIDIAPLHDPKPRFISLKPVLRRVRTRKEEKQTIVEGAIAADTIAEDSARSSRVSEISGNADNIEITSVAPSEASNDTSESSKAGSGGNSGRASVKNENSNRDSDEKNSKQKRLITATIELLKAGYLRGDNIPIKITVRHSKPVKSLHGIIVTLYRQARVDMHPQLPLANRGGKKAKEEYYPKSMTGLGGLSLTSAGSSHMFRKDLSQSYAPLLVDPKTLTTEVKAAVRVPDEAFPTIATVPGGMISFKYFVEVLVDLQGKLSSLGKLNSGMMSVPSTYGNVPGMGLAEDASGSMVSSWGGNFIDTESIRRENKSIVACVFEVIIGTRDTARRKGKHKVHIPNANIPHDDIHAETSAQGGIDPHYVGYGGHENYDTQNGYEGYNGYNGYDTYDGYHDYQYDTNYNIAHHDHYYGQYPQGHEYHEMPHSAQGQPITPMPTLEDESQLPEKERLRRAEERLLPSQPPEAGQSSADAATHAPSAPAVDDSQQLLSPAYTPTINGHPQSPMGTDLHSPSAPDISQLSIQEPSAPSYDDIPSGSSSAAASATDDKQELHRRRLEMERSAPERIPEEEGEDNEPTPSPATSSRSAISRPSAPPMSPSDFTPSAPPQEVIEAEEEQRALGLNPGPTTEAGVRESLPQYEPR